MRQQNILFNLINNKTFFITNQVFLFSFLKTLREQFKLSKILDLLQMIDLIQHIKYVLNLICNYIF